MRRGRRGAIGRNTFVGFNGFLKDSKRFIEEVCRTAEGHMNLVDRLFPPAFLVEGLKTAMMVIQDRLFRLEHETVD